MREHLARTFRAMACAALAAGLLAAPVSAQTTSGATNPPASYGNSGSTAAGPGTGTTLRYNNATPADGSGGWGVWGLVGLLGLFGLSRRSRRGAAQRLPHSGAPAADVPTITDVPPSSTAPRPGMPASGVPPSEPRP